MGRVGMKILLLISDGMGDLPVEELGGKTPLEAAKTPNLDKLAEKGQTGKMHVLEKGKTPHSDEAHLTLFGYELKKHYVGRGPFEALGLGINLRHGDIAFRCNFGTVGSDGIVTDRRAGRIRDVKPLAEELNGMRARGVEFLVVPGTAHRAALIMRGQGLSEKVSDGDPRKEGRKALEIRAMDDSKEAKFTADALNEFLEKAHTILDKHSLNAKRRGKGLLPANFLLPRGAGKMKSVPNVMERFGLNACCIAGAGLYKGVAKFVGMDILEVEGATGRPDTDVSAKISRAIKELKERDYVFVHVKGCDIFGHDGNATGKMEFIEKIDIALKPLLGLKNVLIAVTADHSTPVSRKDHSADPVPVLLSGGIEADSVKEFGERECEKGSLGEIMGKNFMKLLLEKAK